MHLHVFLELKCSVVPVAGLPRRAILWLEPRYACWPQLLTLFTSAQICCRVICNYIHTHRHASATFNLSPMLRLPWGWCHVSPVPGASPPTGYHCCHLTTPHWCSAHENRYFPNCRNHWSHCYEPAIERRQKTVKAMKKLWMHKQET